MSDDSRRRKPARYASLEALPPNLVGEIIGDSLYASPRPAPSHALAASGLGALIGGPFHYDQEGPGGWWILFEPELHLGADVLVPDIAGWRRERMTVLPEEAFINQAPDWVCEVVSPRTASLDRVEKLPVYAREGVSFAWIVDPQARSLEVFSLIGSRLAFLKGWTGDERVRAEPFQEIELDLGRLWLPKAP